MPPIEEVIFLGAVPFILTAIALAVTFRPWRASAPNHEGNSTTPKLARFAWGKDERRSGALLIGLALIAAQLGLNQEFNWPLNTENDYRLAVIAAATAAALFAPTCKAPLWLAAILRLIIAASTTWLITFVYRESDTWSNNQAVGYALAIGAGIAAVWTILQRVSERAPAPIAPFAITALAGASMPIMIFRAGYITPGQLASVIALIAGLFFMTSLIRSRVTLGSGIGVAIIALAAMLTDIVRVAAANAYGEPNPVPAWWAALLIASPALTGAVLLPGIKSWHPLARIALGATLAGIIPLIFAIITLQSADLSAYGITSGNSGGAEPAW